jgi:hypothetical protein
MLHIAHRGLLRDSTGYPSRAEQEVLASGIADLLKRALEIVDVSLDELTPVQINVFVMSFAGALTGLLDVAPERRAECDFNRRIDKVETAGIEDE